MFVGCLFIWARMAMARQKWPPAKWPRLMKYSFQIHPPGSNIVMCIFNVKSWRKRCMNKKTPHGMSMIGQRRIQICFLFDSLSLCLPRPTQSSKLLKDDPDVWVAHSLNTWLVQAEDLLDKERACVGFQAGGGVCISKTPLNVYLMGKIWQTTRVLGNYHIFRQTHLSPLRSTNSFQY